MNDETKNQKTNSDYLTSSEAAAEFYISTETLRRYEERGLIESTRTPGGHRRFEKEKILALKDMGAEIGRGHHFKGNDEDLPEQILSRQKEAFT